MFKDQTWQFGARIGKNAPSRGDARQPIKFVKEADGQRRHTQPKVPSKAKLTHPQRHTAMTAIVEEPRLPCFEDFALACFLGHHWCSPSLIASSTASAPPRLDSAVVTCMKAFGSAIYAILQQSAGARAATDRFYHDAIVRVNQAIALPQCARDNRTLLAIMILSSFGTAKGALTGVSEDLTVHISGCVALLKARGIAQMQSVEGLMLFVQACVNITSHCLLTRARVPKVIFTLTELGAPFVDYKSNLGVAWTVHRTRLIMTNIYQDIMESRTTDPKATIQYLICLDSGLNKLITSNVFDGVSLLPFPPELPSAGISSTMSPSAIQQFQEINGYNTMRVYRIILHLMVLKLVHGSTATSVSSIRDMELHVRSSTNEIQQQQTAILDDWSRQLACVAPSSHNNTFTAPSILPQVLKPPPGISHTNAAAAAVVMAQSLTGCRVIALDDLEPAILRLSYGYVMIWPLVLTSVTSRTNSANRRRANGSLRLVGTSLALHQATILADVLERDGYT
jgi:hypothetical protein